MNLITAVSEPSQLYLAWQPPEGVKARDRWAVGLLSLEGGGCTLRYLEPGEAFNALNLGAYETLRSLGFNGHPAFKLEVPVHTRGVLETLMRRLPPKTRADFADFKRQFRLDETVQISDFGLLALTEAKLPGDGFSVVDPLDPKASTLDLMTEIAGFRYYVDAAGPLNEKINKQLELVPEPTNVHDGNAVQVLLEGRRIGYVNRLQARTFLQWINEGRVSSVLERTNGSDDRPRAFMFVRVRPTRGSLAA